MDGSKGQFGHVELEEPMVSQKEMPMEMNGSKDQGESWGPRDTEKNVMGGWKGFLKGCFVNQSLY